ncbi:hypothetical protein BH24ACT8_BH24ACT8_03820 [soil metagenome]
MAALSALEITSPALVQEVGPAVPVLIVLGSLLLGGIAGSVLRIEQRLESLAGTVQAFVARRVPAADVGGTSGGISPRERFVEGWLTTSLLFCVGPLTILGSLSDGLGRGIDQLVLKATLDGFAAMAFASTFGLGVLFSAVSVAVVQDPLTVVGVLLGTLLPERTSRRSPRSVARSWSGSPCGCCACGTSRWGNCSQRSRWPRC